jgi:hypothetical protein
LGDTEYNHASKTFMTSFWNGEIIKDWNHVFFSELHSDQFPVFSCYSRYQGILFLHLSYYCVFRILFSKEFLKIFISLFHLRWSWVVLPPFHKARLYYMIQNCPIKADILSLYSIMEHTI